MMTILTTKWQADPARIPNTGRGCPPKGFAHNSKTEKKPAEKPPSQHWQVSAETMRNRRWRLRKFAADLGLQDMVKDL